MNKRKLTFATAQKIRELNKTLGWGRYKIQQYLRDVEGIDISENTIGALLLGRTYKTRVHAGNKVNPDIVKEIRNLSRLGRKPEWISCHLESKYDIDMTAKGIIAIIRRENWAHVT